MELCFEQHFVLHVWVFSGGYICAESSIQNREDGFHYPAQPIFVFFLPFFSVCELFPCMDSSNRFWPVSVDEIFWRRCCDGVIIYADYWVYSDSCEHFKIIISIIPAVSQCTSDFFSCIFHCLDEQWFEHRVVANIFTRYFYRGYFLCFDVHSNMYFEKSFALDYFSFSMYFSHLLPTIGHA